MTLSELIQRLQDLQTENGDGEVSWEIPAPPNPENDYDIPYQEGQLVRVSFEKGPNRFTFYLDEENVDIGPTLTPVPEASLEDIAKIAQQGDYMRCEFCDKPAKGLCRHLDGDDYFCCGECCHKTGGDLAIQNVH